LFFTGSVGQLTLVALLPRTTFCLSHETADAMEQSDQGQAEDALPELGTELQAKTVN
jgi:hypothetical protein